MYPLRYNAQPGDGGHAFNGETGISRYAAVLLRQEEGAVHTAHRYRTGGTGTRGMGLRDLLAGEDKEPGANGESIPAERRVARGREAYPGHLFAHGDGKRPRPCVRVGTVRPDEQAERPRAQITTSPIPTCRLVATRRRFTRAATP